MSSLCSLFAVKLSAEGIGPLEMGQLIKGPAERHQFLNFYR